MSITPFEQGEQETLDQSAAVPYRLRRGQPQFCLITTSHGRWHFPKGFIDPGESIAETALKEAFEEAGLHGRIVGDPLGCYQILKNGSARTVVAMLMRVTRTDRTWQEQAERQRRWANQAAACQLLAERDLAELLALAVERISEAES